MTVFCGRARPEEATAAAASGAVLLARAKDCIAHLCTAIRLHTHTFG